MRDAHQTSHLTAAGTRHTPLIAGTAQNRSEPVPSPWRPPAWDSYRSGEPASQSPIAHRAAAPRPSLRPPNKDPSPYRTASPETAASAPSRNRTDPLPATAAAHPPAEFRS